MNKTYDYPFLNPDLPVKDRVKDLVSRLTLEEKLGLLPTNQKAVERLGIKKWSIGTECARGFIGYDEPLENVFKKIAYTTGLEIRLNNGKYIMQK